MEIKYGLASVLFAVVAACSSDPATGEHPDVGADVTLSENAANNTTSRGGDCLEFVDCETRISSGEFFEPENVECRVDPEDGNLYCIECLSASDCPDKFKCYYHACMLDLNQVDPSCETVDDCQFLIDAKYFPHPERVECTAVGTDLRCAECVTDDDCETEEVCTSLSICVTKPSSSADAGFSDMDAGIGDLDDTDMN